MEEQWTVGARIDEIVDTPDAFKNQDPFNKPWDDIKSLAGLPGF